MQQRIFGLENEYGLIFSPNGKIYLPMEKVLGYTFEGLIPNSWPSNAFLVNAARHRPRVGKQLDRKYAGQQHDGNDEKAIEK